MFIIMDFHMLNVVDDGQEGHLSFLSKRIRDTRHSRPYNTIQVMSSAGSSVRTPIESGLLGAMANIRKLGATVILFWFIAVGGWGSTAMVAADAPLPDCTPTLITLQNCLEFVTGKAATPSSSCCAGVLNAHLTNPACLCVLAEDDNTTRMIPNYHIDLAGQLPTLCKIQGASISNCPALLGQNGTSPASVPDASAPTFQSPGRAYRLTISGSLRAFVITYLGIILASSSLISYFKC